MLEKIRQILVVDNHISRTGSIIMYRIFHKISNVYQHHPLEPDLFFEATPDIPVSPQQDARDFKTLRSLVDEKSPTTKFIAGPDVSSISNSYFGQYVVLFSGNV